MLIIEVLLYFWSNSFYLNTTLVNVNQMKHRHLVLLQEDLNTTLVNVNQIWNNENSITNIDLNTTLVNVNH